MLLLEACGAIKSVDVFHLHVRLRAGDELFQEIGPICNSVRHCMCNIIICKVLYILLNFVSISACRTDTKHFITCIKEVLSSNLSNGISTMQGLLTLIKQFRQTLD
jgi:hypothetical protein